MVETQLDKLLTIRWVTWIHTLSKWSTNGTEANPTIATILIEMPLLPNNEKNRANIWFDHHAEATEDLPTAEENYYAQASTAEK